MSIYSALSDINNITECHIKCFPTAFSTKLGKAFVRKTFEWFIVSPNCFLLHISNNENKVIGYCGGFISQYQGDGSTSGMMKYGMKEAFKAALKKPSLFFYKEVRTFYPLIVKNIYRKIIPFKNKTGDIKTVTRKKAGLVIVGVHPEFRGTGIFEQLISAFEKEAWFREIHELSLSVRISNTRAINAYKKTGWQIIKRTDSALYMEKQTIYGH